MGVHQPMEGIRVTLAQDEGGPLHHCQMLEDSFTFIACQDIHPPGRQLVFEPLGLDINGCPTAPGR